jgi:hypothetical protein
MELAYLSNDKTRSKIFPLNAFSLSNKYMYNESFDFIQSLIDKSPLTNIKSRLMQLNHEDPDKTTDVILDFDFINEQYYFATILRFAYKNSFHEISDELLDKTKVTLDEFVELSNSSNAIYLKHWHICLNNNYLISTLSYPIESKRIETNINWFLNTNIFRIIPTIYRTKQVKLSDISSISIHDPFTGDILGAQNDRHQTEIKSKPLNGYLSNILSQLIQNTDSLNGINLSQNISAELTLKINKSNKDSYFRIKKFFDTNLKPINDLCNVTLKDNKGRIIRSEKIVQPKPVKIDLTKNCFPVENQLKHEMLIFLHELEDNENYI